MTADRLPGPAPDAVDPAGGAWRVGDLARRTGLTVRALHHYDHLGLLVPSRRSSGGHRLYTSADLVRLYRIRSLRALGFELGQIARLLDDPRWQLGETLARHRTQLDARLETTTRLRARLAEMQSRLGDAGDAAADDWIAALEEMTMLDSPARNSTTLVVYDDLAAAHEWLVRVLQLTPGPVTRDDDGRVVHAEVVAGSQVIALHPSAEDYRSPRHTGAVTAMLVVIVDDLEAHHSHVVAGGAEIVEEPVDQYYGVREYGVRDLEGHLWFFHQPLEGIADA